MRRKGSRRLADKRLTREVGDRVKLTKAARNDIYRETGIRIEPYEIGTVTKVFWDIQWYAVVGIHGIEVSLYLRDLVSVKD